MAYNPDLAYEADEIIALDSMNHHKRKYCNDLKWKEETPEMCCNNGKVQLLSFEHLPDTLNNLLMDRHPYHNHFMNLIRKYNSCFQMTSFGVKKNCNRRIYAYFQSSTPGLSFGSLMHKPDQNAKISQIYFVGKDETEVRLRWANFSDVKSGLVAQLQRMLHEKKQLCPKI